MRRLLPPVVVAALLVVAGCGPADDAPQTPLQSPRSIPTSELPSTPATPTTPTTATATTATPTTEAAPPPKPARRVRQRGIDASHHQGAIDWRAVAGDGVAFAYLKATEGTSYTDPTFAGHRAAAQDHGIQVGGYHYFQLCSPGVEQAAHFASVLGTISADSHLPPAVDLELAGSCPAPPPRAVLLAEVRAFLEQVEAATEREPVVYLYPELEDEYGFAAELGDYRQWVRSLGERPGRPWWIWQQTDAGSIAGVSGPVDVNVRWVRVGDRPRG